MKYTIKHLRAEFGTENKCLQFVFDNRYGKKFSCPNCEQKGKFYLIEGRKRFDCVCGYTVSPLADTIFHKSSTPLTLWFHAIFLFANSRNGVAAKELERQLGVTYKCAWRIAKQVRLLFMQSKYPLSGTIETDAAITIFTARDNLRTEQRKTLARLVGKEAKNEISND